MKTLIRAAAVVLLLAGMAATTRAQPRQNGLQAGQQQVAIPASGTDLFRALLDKEGIQPVRTQDVWRANDAQTIVIVLGNTRPAFNTPIDPLRHARDVVANGGAALIATDSYTQLRESDGADFGNPLGWVLGAEVNADWRDVHAGRSECPYVVPTSPEELRPPPKNPGRVWNVFRGLNKIATNSPSYLRIDNFRGEYQYSLARFPRSLYLVDGGQFNVVPHFAVGGDGPPGNWNSYSFLAMADSSVFINQMLLEPGTDNLELTLRTIEYLQGPDKTRNKCVFIENGVVKDKFDGLRQALAKPKPKLPAEAMPNLPALAGKNQDKLVDLANGLADQVQKKDGLHNMLVGRAGSESERRAFGRWAEVVAVIASVFIALFLLRRMWRARQPLDVPPPPATGAGTASTGPPGVFDRRQKELVRRNNLYEPVRDMLREFFDSVGAPASPGPRLPRLEISDAVRKPDSLRQALRDMWRLAYGPPMTISAQRWFELEPYFDRLKQAHADGKWRFLGAE